MGWWPGNFFFLWGSSDGNEGAFNSLACSRYTNDPNQEVCDVTLWMCLCAYMPPSPLVFCNVTHMLKGLELLCQFVEREMSMSGNWDVCVACVHVLQSRAAGDEGE